MKKFLISFGYFILIFLLSILLNQLTLKFLTKGDSFLNNFALIVVPIIGSRIKNKNIQNASYLTFFIILIFFLLFYTRSFWS